MVRILDYIAGKEDNIKLIVVDTMDHCDKGKEDWSSEAEYIKRKIGTIDAIYSSEPSYTDFYEKAYPGAIHRLIDPERKTVPISGTKIRSMGKANAKEWLVRR